MDRVSVTDRFQHPPQEPRAGTCLTSKATSPPRELPASHLARLLTSLGLAHLSGPTALRSAICGRGRQTRGLPLDSSIP